MTLPDLQQV